MPGARGGPDLPVFQEAHPSVAPRQSILHWVEVQLIGGLCKRDADDCAWGHFEATGSRPLLSCCRCRACGNRYMQIVSKGGQAVSEGEVLAIRERLGVLYVARVGGCGRGDGPGGRVMTMKSTAFI